MPRLVVVTTVPWSLRFYAGQVQYMQSRGLDVVAISSPHPFLDEFAAANGVETLGVEMPRTITPKRDAGALWRLAETIHRLAPDIVHANTPKGGLLGTTAAYLADVPGRVYHIKGLPFETATGGMRALLRTTERVSCGLATDVLCVSEGVRQIAIDAGIVAAPKISVVAHGSSNGVDAARRFDPDARPAGERDAVRREWGVPADATVVGFVGRLVRDKGIVELADAWHRVRDDHPGAYLVLIGPYEPRDPVPDTTRRALADDPRVVVVDEMVGGIERLYGAMDLVALPTYREGLPNVVLEAQAMRLPVVATTIPGCREASRDGVTSLLVPVGDDEGLAAALHRYLASPNLRRAHGRAGRAWVLDAFAPERIWAGTYERYAEILARR